MILREGQQVRVKNYSEDNIPDHFSDEMEKFCGKTVTVDCVHVSDFGVLVEIKEIPDNYFFFIDDLEIIHSFKNLFQTGRIIENGYGIRRLVVDDLAIGTVDCVDFSYYDDSLEHISGDKDLDIIAVYVMDEPGSLEYILSHPGDLIWRRM